MGYFPFVTPSSSGGVQTVTAGDSSINIGGTTANPTIETDTLNTIAANHTTDGNVGMNGFKLTGLASGSASTDSAAYGQTLAGGDLAPLTTEGDLLYANATPAPARLALGAVNTHLASTGTLPAYQLGLELQETTGATGYALVNGTGSILTWTAPNDGALHRVMIFGNIDVASAETGGQITVTAFDQSGNELFLTSDPGGHSTGTKTIFTVLALTVKANTVVTLLQNTALTVGAATVWAEMWAS